MGTGPEVVVEPRLPLVSRTRCSLGEVTVRAAGHGPARLLGRGIG